jgi:hypothetical protein
VLIRPAVIAPIAEAPHTHPALGRGTACAPRVWRQGVNFCGIGRGPGLPLGAGTRRCDARSEYHGSDVGGSAGVVQAGDQSGAAWHRGAAAAINASTASALIV